MLLSQVVHDHITDPGASELPEPELASALLYYGSVTNTMLSLFMSIAGGCSWDLVIAPLQHISLVWTLVFLFFISFTYFAVLNAACRNYLRMADRQPWDKIRTTKGLKSTFNVFQEGSPSAFTTLISFHQTSTRT